jgi:hypothetical protein
MEAVVLFGEGTLLQLGDGATTEVFTTIAQRVSISGPDSTVPVVDKSNLDSPAKEKRPGKIPDQGKLSLQIQFNPADTTHTTLETMCRVPVVKNWRIVFNNDTTTRPHRQLRGFVSGFSVSGMEDESNVVADLEIEISGLITNGTTTIS